MANSQSRSLIYVVRNNINGKLYVGQTVYTLDCRWRGHLHQARTTRPGQAIPVFIRAIQKYGPNAFTMSLLLELPPGSSKADRDAAESKAIADLNTLVPHGYNLRTGGSHGLMHDTTKAKISAGNRGKQRSAEAKERYRQARLNETPEARRHRTAKLKGRKADPSHIDKMNSARAADRSWLTDEVRFKMGSSARGKKRHPSVTEAIRQAHLGVKRTPEQCARIRAGILAALARKRELAVA